MLIQDKSTKLWELHILGDRIGVGLVKCLNQGSSNRGRFGTGTTSCKRHEMSSIKNWVWGGVG